MPSGLCKGWEVEHVDKMKSAIHLRLFVVSIGMLPLMACRQDFSVRSVDGQKVILRSSTALAGDRETMFQFDSESRTLFSYQTCVKVRDRRATAIRAYDLQKGLRTEWYVSDYIDNEFAPAVVLGEKLYFADVREWKGSILDNLREVDLSKSSGVSSARLLKGALPTSHSCRGLMRIGKGRLLLKLFDAGSQSPCLALFDPVERQVVRRVDLENQNEGDYAWSPSSDRFDMAVSPDLLWVALRDRVGLLSFYDASLSLCHAVEMKDLLQLEGLDSDWGWIYAGIHLEWMGNRMVVLWSRRDGQWWNYDVNTRQIVDRGKLSLRTRKSDPSDRTDVFNKKEYIQLALARKRFLVKGFKENLLRKEGYIVEVGETGEEKREPVGWGMWPKAMLTENCFYAEEF